MAEKKEDHQEKKAPKCGISIRKVSASELAKENIQYLPDDEWFSKFKEDILDGILGNPMDGIMRNIIRMSTLKASTRQLGVLPPLIGKNWLWLQVFMVDENRVIQGKFHGLEGQVSAARDQNVAQLSRKLFKEAVPFLLQDGGAGHWVFSRSKFVSRYNCLVDDASDFSEYDPLNSVKELPVDVPSGVRCTEAFLILAGEFEVRGDGFSNRDAVLDLLHELISTGGHKKLLGFGVCCASVQVSREKLNELKNVHMTA